MATERTVLVRLKASVGDFVAGMGTAKAAVAGLTREIDTTNDRTAWLAQSILALGPALVPIGAAATPVLTGIATQFTVAAGAAGVAALAFNGVGDGLKALNDYQLEPTAAHLEKVRQEFEKLGPDGVHFVQFLDEVAPKFEQLQLAARAGMLPGVEEGITNVLDLMPQLKSLTTDLATAMGQLASEAGEGLAGEGFEDFFDFMDRQARPLLLDMGHIMGNFAEGFGAMLAAFEPATMAYSKGFLEMSESFAQWAHGLEDSQTFEDFLAYIEEAGPKVAELIGSITDAFVSIVQAAAPVGDVMLPALESFFDVIAKIAATPIGTMFIGITAAMSVYGRAAALASITTGGLGKAFLTAGGGALKGSAGVKTLSADLGVLARNAMTAGAASQRMAAQSAAAAANLRATAKGVGSAAGMAALFAVSMSDMDDKAGLTNATMGAMVGTIGGPWGMAIGGGIGLALDFAAANDEAEAAIRRTNSALKSTDLTVLNAQVSALDELLADLAADKDFDWSLNPIQHIQEGWSWAFAQLNDMGDELETTKANAELLAHDLEIAFASIARAMNPDAFKGPGGMDMVPTLEQLGKVAERVTPALADLGISTEEFIAAAQGGGDAWSSMRDEIVTYLSNADSAAGRTDAVADAIAGLDDQLESTVTSAEALKNSLDALLTPGMNLSATTDAWRAGLRNLNDELAENSRSLTAQTDAADQNREAVRGLVTNLRDNLVAQAEAGFGAGELARNLTKQRDALIEAGVAAGLSRDQLRAYLNDLGLTPKLVTTILQARTDEATRKVRAIQALVDQYGVTRAQARAMLDDLASGKIGNVQKLIDKYGLTKAQATAMLRDQASGEISRITALLANIPRTITTYVNVVRRGLSALNFGGSADGSTVPKTGLPYADRHPYLLADGEEVISNRYGQADRWRPLLKAINANRLADGGTAGVDDFISVAHDLRATRALADGGTARAAEPAYRMVVATQQPAAAPIVVNLSNLRVTGTLQTPWGPAQIEGIARSAAQQEIESDRRFQSVRMGGGQRG